MTPRAKYCTYTHGLITIRYHTINVRSNADEMAILVLHTAQKQKNKENLIIKTD